MADSTSISSEVEPVITAAAYEAESSYASQHPKEFDQIWAEISRQDPQLALSLLSHAKQAAESGRPTGEVCLESSLLVMAAIRRQQIGKTLEEQILPEEELTEDNSKRRFFLTRKRKETEQKVKIRGLKRTVAAITVLFTLDRVGEPKTSFDDFDA